MFPKKSPALVDARLQRRFAYSLRAFTSGECLANTHKNLRADGFERETESPQPLSPIRSLRCSILKSSFRHWLRTARSRVHPCSQLTSAHGYLVVEWRNRAAIRRLTKRSPARLFSSRTPVGADTIVLVQLLF